jgi:ferrous iron transport protein B
MPAYKLPHVRNVSITILQKVRSFVFEAGKIIVAISIILWIGARYGPADRQAQAIAELESKRSELQLSDAEFEARKAAVSLEHSYMGIFGKSIEPAIEPLGYDWKIGIALIASFAAREVFVGTMATIYAVGDTESELTVKEHMARDINRETMLPRYTLGVGASLLVFYALAMQCMSTLAVVYRETKGWKWPIIQFTYMSGLAYILSFISYQFFK